MEKPKPPCSPVQNSDLPKKPISFHNKKDLPDEIYDKATEEPLHSIVTLEDNVNFQKNTPFSPIQNSDLPQKPIPFHNEKDPQAEIYDKVSEEHFHSIVMLENNLNVQKNNFFSHKQHFLCYFLGKIWLSKIKIFKYFVFQIILGPINNIYK